ncbi:DNA-binding transcriptional regulator YhcF (GntR family) [Agrobacterium tumefaciens]|uniref:GntR family transcriptional regulator n=1 Tax=Agrobacterium tumefaciens TaxID=358 RepID=UPI000DD5C4CA|nr:GntR family transcriptional regulator [Agrobacterium tumefaciens]MBP2574086.1 DNA-binding transcriptional regulator YhcF (GntR family) [Agrobacterium tumefaciens]
MRTSTDSVVMADLRRRLFLGDLRAGSPIRIADIADDVGVSTAPVRDALMRLSERGIIARIEGRGFFVSTTPDHEASELLGILHKIVIFAIKRGKGAGPFDQEPLDRSDAHNGWHDDLNIMFERICSPPVASLATTIADRLWDLRRRIAEQQKFQSAETRLAQVVIRSLGLGDGERAQRIVNASYNYCQQFLMRQIISN